MLKVMGSSHTGYRSPICLPISKRVLGLKLEVKCRATLPLTAVAQGGASSFSRRPLPILCRVKDLFPTCSAEDLAVCDPRNSHDSKKKLAPASFSILPFEYNCMIEFSKTTTIENLNLATRNQLEIDVSKKPPNSRVRL